MHAIPSWNKCMLQRGNLVNVVNIRLVERCIVSWKSQRQRDITCITEAVYKVVKQVSSVGISSGAIPLNKLSRKKERQWMNQ